MRNHHKATRNLSLSLAAAFLAGGLGCKSNTPAANAPAPIINANNGPDPAAANLAPVGVADASAGAGYAAQPASNTSSASRGRVLGQRSSAPSGDSSYEQYPAQAQDDATYQNGVDSYNNSYDNSYGDSQAEYAEQAPPPLPVYQQPELTDPGDEWTPGYWNYASTGYYWVPGAWVAPPYGGALWTPGYWGYEGRRYRFHHGYWGRHIGFYGGIPYGFGYTGVGYEGGYWNGNNFFYNRQVNRIGGNNVRNVYERNVTVINNNTRISYNGPGGIESRPRPAEIAALHEQRTPPMQAQVQNQRGAAVNRQQYFAENHGQPAVAVRTEHFGADRAPNGAVQQGQAAGQATRGLQPGVQQPGVQQAGRPQEAAGQQVNPQRGGFGQAQGRPGQPIGLNAAGRQGQQPGAERRGQVEPQRPGQPQMQGTRPGLQQPQGAQAQREAPQQQVRTPEQARGGQFQGRPQGTPQGVVPQPQRPQYQQPAQQARPQVQPQQARPQVQPQRPQYQQPAQQARPQVQPQQARPQVQPQAPRPAEPQRSAPAPQPQARPAAPAAQPHAEAPHGAPGGGEHPRK